MKILKFTLGIFQVNNYLIYSPKTREAILIDSCEEVDPILDTIREENLKLIYLINTHGHGDHILGNKKILEATEAQLLIHPLDAPYLSDPQLNLSGMFGFPYTSPPADRLVEEGDVIQISDISLSVLHTPGHTPGHISLTDGKVAFVGDVIFREGIGRTDFPNGDYDQLIETIRTKIYTLPDSTVLYNGHGPETTVAHEREHNPFVRG